MMPTDTTRILDAKDHMPDRTILDEIQEALERYHESLNDEATDPEAVARRSVLIELLYDNASPLVAVVRLAPKLLQEAKWFSEAMGGCDHSVGMCQCQLDTLIEKANEALRTLDPRLLGES